MNRLVHQAAEMVFGQPEADLAKRVLPEFIAALGEEPMMRGCQLILIAFLVPVPARADDFVIRDEGGRTIGTVERNSSGHMVHRDQTGRRIGTVEDGFGGQMVLRDGGGRRTGTVEPGFGQGFVVRDPTGKRIQTVEPDSVSGGYVVRDSAGRRIGTVENRRK